MSSIFSHIIIGTDLYSFCIKVKERIGLGVRTPQHSNVFNSKVLVFNQVISYTLPQFLMPLLAKFLSSAYILEILFSTFHNLKCFIRQLDKSPFNKYPQMLFKHLQFLSILILDVTLFLLLMNFLIKVSQVKNWSESLMN